MSRNNRSRGNRNNFNKNQQRKTDVASDDDNLVTKAFRGYAQELDDKHDRYERILKQSRDVTIESKRLIFLLHTADHRKPNFEGILSDAKSRLDSLIQTQFANIAKELRDKDNYQYSRAYSPGLQEFVEALTYYFYLSGEKWGNWYDLQQRLTYHNEVPLASDTDTGPRDDDKEEKADAKDVTKPVDGDAATITVVDTCLVQPIEFFLGIGDLGGEVMRRCVNSLGCGDIEACTNASRFLQNLYTCYLGLGNVRNKDMGRKIFTLRQSVQKAENVCYNITVRGGEAAVWGADDTPGDKGAADVDEGYANY